MKKLIFTLVAIIAMAGASKAQEVALKWNPVALGVGAMNVGAEFSVAPNWTLSLDGSAVIFNPLKNMDDNSFHSNGWMATFEGRYYFNEAFRGHHLGVYLSGARFAEMTTGANWFKIFSGGADLTNASDVRAIMLGISYGYYIAIGEHFGLDIYVGGGILFGSHDNNNIQASNKKEYTTAKFNLSRAGIALSYKF